MPPWDTGRVLAVRTVANVVPYRRGTGALYGTGGGITSVSRPGSDLGPHQAVAVDAAVQEQGTCCQGPAPHPPNAYPTASSMCSSMRRFHSTAYSMGKVRVTGSMKPLTTIDVAWSHDRPRLIR